MSGQWENAPVVDGAFRVGVHPDDHTFIRMAFSGKLGWAIQDMPAHTVDALIAALTAARDEAKRLNEEGGG